MVRINGNDVCLQESMNLYNFLSQQNYDPTLVVVEVDKNLVKRKDYEKFMLEDGMSIEVFSFIGGG